MNKGTVLAVGLALAVLAPGAGAQDEIVAVGGEGRHCGEDPGCRWFDDLQKLATPSSR